MPEGTVVIGTIGSDCHIVGNMIVSRSLETAGFKVVQLGACVSQEEFIDAAVETNADAILVSSMYGMGFFDCEGLRDKCTESGLDDILLYIGGFLSVEDEDDASIRQRYESIGFDRVYPPSTKPRGVGDDLKHDLGVKRGDSRGTQ
jgi:methylaspartate mutase sigma subunit